MLLTAQAEALQSTQTHNCRYYSLKLKAGFNRVELLLGLVGHCGSKTSIVGSTTTHAWAETQHPPAPSSNAGDITCVHLHCSRHRVILCAAGAIMCAEGGTLVDCALSSRACRSGTAQQVDKNTPDSHSVLTTELDLSWVGEQPKQRTPSQANFKVSHPQQDPQPACSRAPSQHAAGTVLGVTPASEASLTSWQTAQGEHQKCTQQSLQGSSSRLHTGQNSTGWMVLSAHCL